MAAAIDIAKAMLDPEEVFAHPREVVENKELSRDIKCEILQRWRYEILQHQVAEDEANMPLAANECDYLDEVNKALNELGSK